VTIDTGSLPPSSMNSDWKLVDFDWHYCPIFLRWLHPRSIVLLVISLSRHTITRSFVTWD
jgi:hypothetical protein